MKPFTYIIIGTLLVTTAVSAHAETVTVSVRESAIRADCRFFSPVRAKVRSSDQLTVTAKNGDWYKVAGKGVNGCIHKSAVQTRSYFFSGESGSGKSSASENEVSLAGKGFNPQVESAYRAKNSDLDFSLVDSVQQYQVTDDSLKRFMEAGGLNLP